MAKLTEEILTVLEASPLTFFDAADVLTRLEERNGREYRLASVFNTMLELRAAVRFADLPATSICPALYRAALSRPGDGAPWIRRRAFR